MEVDNDQDLKDSNMNKNCNSNKNKKYQMEYVYNKLLPYYKELENESETMLADIKGNLGRAVMYREIEPGCLLWTKRLNKYIKLYSFKFSKEDHIYFVKLYYELITIPDIDPYQIKEFANILILLLKKIRLLSPDDLTLPWRPLYELNKKVLCRATTALGMYHFHPLLPRSLSSLIRLCRIYFPLNATQEILDEFRPMICPFNDNFMNIFKKIEYFLPLNLPPQHHSLGHQLWFHEFMNLWNVCRNGASWEPEMMWLMATLASQNIGYIDWEPYIPLMFARFVRCFNLPVSYKQTQDMKTHKMDTLSIAIWIVSVLGNKSSAQIYLEKFLKSIETYFQPANVGKWSGKLREFLMKLPYRFILRIHKERYAKRTWETPIPDEYKLTDEDIDTFVKSMMPLAMTAMFTRLNASDPCLALQYLANMRPNLVIPQVVDRMYSTLDSLTEPHKLTAAMVGMISVAKPMVQGSRNINKGYTYAEGPMHVVPILFSLLPGIDPNDIGKCVVTLRLIFIYALLIPFVDSSKSSAIADEEEKMICEMTSRFEDFILQFLDRIFTFIDTSSLDFIRPENNQGSGKSKLEILAEEVLETVFSTLLHKTSDTIFLSALHKLRVFVSERILETKVAGELVAVICQVFANINGHETLRALVPFLSETILDVIGENDDILKEENLDNRLLYAMLLLSAITETAGNYLLPHMNTFVEILDKVLLLESKEGVNYACRLLKSLLASLSTLDIDKFKTHGRDFNDPEYPYTRHWGEEIDIDSIQINWYIPGKDEFQMVQKLFFRYLPKQLELLQNYCQDWNCLSREKLLAVLRIVNCIVKGCEDFLPFWEEPPLTCIESSLEWAPFNPTSGDNYEIVMPDGSNVKKYLINILSNLQNVLLKNVEDETRCLLNLVLLWEFLLLGDRRMQDFYEDRQKKMKRTQNLLNDRLVKSKKRVEHILMEQAFIHHETRLQLKSHKFTETHKNIMLELVALATSRYANVRNKAQFVLTSGILTYPFSYTFIVPHLIDVLEKDSEIHHDAFKGVLYILHRPLNDPIITQRNWHMLRSLLPKLILSKPSEKLSVIRLKEQLIDTMKNKYQNMFIELEIPDRCLIAASKLWEHYPHPMLSKPNENEIEKGIEKLKETSRANLESYYGLCDDLLNAILETNLHWRHRLMSMEFIRIFTYEKYPFSLKAVRYFLEALIHDSLDERKIAIRVIVHILRQQKRKHPKISVPITDVCKKELLSDAVIPGERADNTWLQYDYNNRPTTSKQWDEQRYIHRPNIGYYTWPKIIEFYAPSCEQPTLDPKIRQFTDEEMEVERFFDNPQNIDKIIEFYSIEEKMDKDRYNCYKYLLFKSIFRNHGITPLKHFVPHLHELVKDKQESKQRCATEIIAGIIQGSKHWPFEMVCDMWNELLPIIRSALDNLTVETIIDWTTSISLSMHCRDPNRQHWLLECLMEEPTLGEFESSFIESGRLCVLQGVLIFQPWRLTQLMQRLLIRLENRLLTNPFKNLRDRIGALLFVVFEADLRFPISYSNRAIPQAQHFIDKVIPKLQILAENSEQLFNESKQSLTTAAAVNNDLKSDDNSVNNIQLDINEREATIRLLKIICKWVAQFVYKSPSGTLPEFYQLFPIICQMENYETDDELVQICTNSLAFLAQSIILPDDMPTVLNAIVKMSTNVSWSARDTCLEFLQTSIFYNMSIVLMKEEWVNCIKDVVLHLLEDIRLEVREKAGHVLGGLLHCGFIPDQNALLEQFKLKAKTKLHKKGRSMHNQTEAERNANADALRLRHAGVLGLCAFIRAHPYDVPNYLPFIFEHLDPHLNDPQPVPTTIRKVLGDFNRTHYDGWNGINGHAQHFTERQLTILQDLLVPPSYYA
ncbi:PREDICTED: proteasome activator complex subunit 4B-like [Polistes dominula]|uniref:Proteasome activator complex subunit 4B-like n=1 Tax=Polistes dominula TaxID=743375 RepID=A0ABM1IDA5_POLDO|nr:PREDICTED: proteasome activator complex subunit 4B-like [Polistes dominula]